MKLSVPFKKVTQNFVQYELPKNGTDKPIISILLPKANVPPVTKTQGDPFYPPAINITVEF